MDSHKHSGRKSLPLSAYRSVFYQLSAFFSIPAEPVLGLKSGCGQVTSSLLVPRTTLNHWMIIEHLLCNCALAVIIGMVLTSGKDR